MTDHRIVVGVDGTEGGRRALRWALHEAAARGGTVRAVLSWRWDTAEPTRPAESVRADAETTLRHEIESQQPAAPPSVLPSVSPSVPPPVTVEAEVVEGRAAEVLVRAARDADLLVLGSHGHDRVYHTVLGSTAQECVESARCPVVVIPAGVRAPAGLR